MSPFFKKLFYRDQDKILVLNLPDQLKKETEKVEDKVKIVTKPNRKIKVEFSLVFVQNVSQIEMIFPNVEAMFKDDVVFWIAYPKKTSKRFPSDLSRKNPVWELFGRYGYRAVSEQDLNTDWNAVRFRRERYIKANPKTAPNSVVDMNSLEKA